MARIDAAVFSLQHISEAAGHGGADLAPIVLSRRVEMLSVLNRAQALVEACMFCTLLVFAGVLYANTRVLIHWHLLLALAIVNGARISLVIPGPWLCWRLRVSENKRQLVLGVLGTVFSVMILVGGVWCLVTSLRTKPDEAGHRWEQFLMVWLLITNNFMCSGLWLMTQLVDVQDRREREVSSVFVRQLAENRRYYSYSPKKCLPKPEVTSCVLEEGMAGDGAGAVCVICLDELSVGCVAGRLPCGHVFHDECVRTWLRNESCDARCPMRCALAAAAPWQPWPAPAVIGSSSSEEAEEIFEV